MTKPSPKIPGMTLIALMIFVFAFSTTRGVVAQTAEPSPTPSQQELQLQEQKRLLELQRDIELAKKAIRDAQKPDAKPTPPAPSATPLTGETTLDDGVRMETDIVSYKAMAEAAHAVVSDIDDRLRNNAGAKKPISNLAIYDAQVVKDWRFFQALFPAFHGQTEDILNSYKNLVCFNAQVDANFKQKYCERSSGADFAPDERIAIADFQAGAIQTAFSVGGDLVKSFIDLAALFRTETKITGKSLTIDETALTAEVFRVFKSEKPDTNLFYPRMFSPRVNPNGQSKTLQDVGMLFVFKSEADRLIKLETDQQAALADGIKVQIKEKAQLEPELVQVKQLKKTLGNLYGALRAERIWTFRHKLWEEIREIETELSSLKSQAELEATIAKLKGQINPVLGQIDASDATIKPLAELNARFEKFVNEFVKVDENGNNALALFIKSEDIDEAMPGDDSYWLEIKALAAGGNNRTRRNLIWFFAGARVDHSGGVIIEYTLYNKAGAVVVSDQLSHYKGYVPPKKIVKGDF